LVNLLKAMIIPLVLVLAGAGLSTGIIAFTPVKEVIFQAEEIEYLPFSNVEIVFIKAEENQDIRTRINFTKLECDFSRISIYGYFPDGNGGTNQDILVWTSNRPASVDPNRLPGSQSAVFTIETEGKLYSKFEIRSLHLCPRANVPTSELVEKTSVFAIFDAPVPYGSQQSVFIQN